MTATKSDFHEGLDFCPLLSLCTTRLTLILEDDQIDLCSSQINLSRFKAKTNGRIDLLLFDLFSKNVSRAALKVCSINQKAL